MNRLIKGMTYSFHRNLGKRDRIIRALFALCGIASWYFGAIVGVIGIAAAVLGLMLLGTAVSSRCAITYIAKTNTISEDEKRQLDGKRINYEK